jgi:ribosomal protein L32
MNEHLSARQRRPSMARRKKRRIGAFSRRLTISDLDVRTNAGKYVNSIKNDLEAQIGTPSPGQQILIKLVAVKRCFAARRYQNLFTFGPWIVTDATSSLTTIPSGSNRMVLPALINFANKNFCAACSPFARKSSVR